MSSKLKKDQLRILKSNKEFIIRAREDLEGTTHHLPEALKSRFEFLLLISEKQCSMLLEIYKGFDSDKLN